MTENVEVREMRDAETILGIIQEPFIKWDDSGSGNRPLASRLRSKDSRAVLRGAVGKVPIG